MLRGHGGKWVRGADFSADGKWLVTGGWDGTVQLWDVTRKNSVATLQAFSNHEEAFSGWVMGLAFHPREDIIAVGNGAGEITIWDAHTRYTKKTFQAHDDKLFLLEFSPDGSYLLSATGNWSGNIPGEVKVWDSKTFEERGTFFIHDTGVSTLVFTPDGRTLVTGAFDGTVSLWKFQSGKVLSKIKDFTGHLGTGWVLGSAVSSDGRLLATGGGQSVMLWDLTLKAQIGELPHRTDALAFTPDDRTLVTGSFNTIRLWNVETQREMITLEGHEGYIQKTVFSPDGTILATASGDGTVRVWKGAAANVSGSASKRDIALNDAVTFLKAERATVLNHHER